MKNNTQKICILFAMLFFCAISLSGCGGAPDVEKLKSQGNIKGLISAYGYDNDEESDQVSIARREAIRLALLESGAEAVEPLVLALKDKDVNIQRLSASLLGELKDTRATEALMGALDDKRLESIALESLCKIADPRSAEALMKYADQEKVANGGLIEINVKYVSPVLSGKGVDATVYQKGTPGPHPVVIADERPFSGYRTEPTDSDPPNWNALMPEDWRALGEPRSIQLVLCWDQVEDVLLESVEYSNGITGKRVIEKCTVSLREAATGKVVAVGVLTGDEPIALTTFTTETKDFRWYGPVTADHLISWLRPYVD